MTTPGRRLLRALTLTTMMACGSTDATTNRTFYHWALGNDARAFERPYPKLDWPEGSETPEFVGVSVLDGSVQLSRPRNWRLRQASNRPTEPYVHYVSPNAYSFAVYRRRDPPSDPWQEIRARFEEDVALSGARLVDEGVPMAVSRGQGWAYGIEKDVPAAQAPLLARSREMLVRDERLVVLVQIVYQEKDLANVDQDLLRVVESLRLR